MKVIPDAEGGAKPSLAQLVETRTVNTPHVGSDGNAELYSGDASITYGLDSDSNLPVKEVVACLYGHIFSELPYGKILKTYE